MALTFTACGGGGSSSTYVAPTIVATPTPVPSTASTAAPTNASAPLSTANFGGSPGFVNNAGFTVYVFDGDLAQANASSCNGACASVWPSIAPPSAMLPSGWTSFVRQGGGTQLAYKGRALYTYVVDQAPGQTNGDGITEFGAVWHIARP
jgi:predicted lipoprotein with Yx(FWY)xxD motif